MSPDARYELQLAREELLDKLGRGELDEDAFAAESEAVERDTPVSEDSRSADDEMIPF